LEFYQTPITISILIITFVVSMMAFSNTEIKFKYMFNAYMIKHRNQWWRTFTSAFLHGDYIHLFLNMMVLYSFGGILEIFFIAKFGMTKGLILYASLYIGGIFFSHLPAFKRHADNEFYNALGASGAVSAVAFAVILLFPLAPLSLIFFPFFEIPAFILGILYLFYETYMDKRGNSNIGHSAHLGGAAFGVSFMFLLDWRFVPNFLEQVTAYFGA
jgi:membrane associated rhomboid family serine protease